MHIDTKIKCAKAEVKRRKKFYPYLIEKGKMTQEEADFEVQSMLEIVHTLTQLKGIVEP